MSIIWETEGGQHLKFQNPTKTPQKTYVSLLAKKKEERKKEKRRRKKEKGLSLKNV